MQIWIYGDIEYLLEIDALRSQFAVTHRNKNKLKVSCKDWLSKKGANLKRTQNSKNINFTYLRLYRK
jgi:hypothetical protein